MKTLKILCFAAFFCERHQDTLEPEGQRREPGRLVHSHTLTQPPPLTLPMTVYMGASALLASLAWATAQPPHGLQSLPGPHPALPVSHGRPMYCPSPPPTKTSMLLGTCE